MTASVSPLAGPLLRPLQTMSKFGSNHRIQLLPHSLGIGPLNVHLTIGEAVHPSDAICCRLNALPRHFSDAAIRKPGAFCGGAVRHIDIPDVNQHTKFDIVSR
jgi:hypothetical protein